jgi:hypothetical protein
MATALPILFGPQTATSLGEGGTADADPPHGTTGCPFQAWSVAELPRARRLISDNGKGER